MAKGAEKRGGSRDFADLERKALEYISEGVMIISAAGRVIYMDRAMRRMLEVEDAAGEVDLEELDRRIQIGMGRPLSWVLKGRGRAGSWEGEASAVTADGHAVLLHLKCLGLEAEDGRRVHLIIARDVTRERILERQLLQSQQMELLENVSLAVAHEFRNLLTVILAYAAMIEETPLGKEMPEVVRGIRDGVSQANELTARLLSLTRRSGARSEPVAVQQLIDDVAAVMRKVLPRNVALLKPENLDIVPVMGDRNVLYRALLNLCLNARDAMPDGGTLSIEADLVEVGEDEVRDMGARAAGRYVVLSVTDTGVGMPPDILKRIFDPFFTTKRGGTGLGLSAVKHGIEELGGWVKVYSEPGKGSCFRLYVPAVAGAVSAAVEEAGRVPPGKGALILAVDDDALALRVMQKCLERWGYRVIVAGGGEDALTQFRRIADEVAAVVVDVVMPFMNGEEVYKELRRIKPDVKVLAVSGFPPDTARRIFHAEGVPFISKPYACSRLGRSLAELLGRG